MAGTPTQSVRATCFSSLPQNLPISRDNRHRNVFQTPKRRFKSSETCYAHTFAFCEEISHFCVYRITSTDVADGHTASNTEDFLRPPKLSGAGPI